MYSDKVIPILFLSIEARGETKRLKSFLQIRPNTINARLGKSARVDINNRFQILKVIIHELISPFDIAMLTHFVPPENSRCRFIVHIADLSALGGFPTSRFICSTSLSAPTPDCLPTNNLYYPSHPELLDLRLTITDLAQQLASMFPQTRWSVALFVLNTGYARKTRQGAERCS